MHKVAIIGLLALSGSAFSGHKKQFPQEGLQYISKKHSGFEQYKSKSLVKSKKLVLTFDDGPHATRTPKVLDILKKYNARATFFILTKNVNRKTMPIVKRILREGHILASHDHHHGNNNKETMSEFKRELTNSIKTVERIEDSIGMEQKPMYYRFPYGAYGKANGYHHFNVMKEVSQSVYGENCINFAFWDIDSQDWMKLNAQQIAQNVLVHVLGGKGYRRRKAKWYESGDWVIEEYTSKYPRGGGVALLHDIHERSVQATEIILETAKRKGIKIVPLDSVKEYAYPYHKNCDPR